MSPQSQIPLRLCAALVVGHVAFTGYRFILTLHAVHLGASPLQIGMLLGLVMAGPMVLAVQFGRWSDRYGYERLCAIGIPVLVCAGLLCSASTGLTPLYAASVLTGCGYMLAHVAINNAVGKLTPETHTANAFSVIAMSLSLSSFSGPLLAGLAIDHFGFRAAYLVLSAFAAGSGALLWWAAQRFRSSIEASERRTRGNLLELLRDKKLAAVFIASGLLSMGWDLFVFLAPLHGIQAGLSATATGMIVSAFSMGTFTIRLLLGRLSRAASEWRMMTVALALTAAAFVAFPLMQGLWQLLGAAFVVGLSLGCAQPLSMALVYRTAPPHRVGEAAGFRIAITSFSQTALPMLFGGLGSAIGLSAGFWIAAALLAAGIYVTERQPRAR